MSEIKVPTPDRRLPLAEVAFREPTKIPGVSHMVTVLEAGVRRVVDGKDWLPPAMWLDAALRVIKIEGMCYPLERVHYYRQAPSALALSKAPPPLDLDVYTVGARPRKK